MWMRAYYVIAGAAAAIAGTLLYNQGIEPAGILCLVYGAIYLTREV